MTHRTFSLKIRSLARFPSYDVGRVSTTAWSIFLGKELFGICSVGADRDGFSGTISRAAFDMSHCYCRLGASSNLFFSLDDPLKTGA